MFGITFQVGSSHKETREQKNQLARKCARTWIKIKRKKTREFSESMVNPNLGDLEQIDVLYQIFEPKN